METFATLEKETKISLDVYCREIHFLKHLLLEGKFDQVVDLLRILFKDRPSFEVEKIMRVIEKERVIELIDESSKKVIFFNFIFEILKFFNIQI